MDLFDEKPKVFSRVAKNSADDFKALVVRLNFWKIELLLTYPGTEENPSDELRRTLSLFSQLITEPIKSFV